MKRKGRLGGKAWFYAQGQRAAVLSFRGVRWLMNDLADAPAFARNAFAEGYNDVRYARAGKPV